MTLSDNLVAEMQEALKNSTGPHYYWDSSEELSPEQINTLLALPNGLEAVEMEVLTSRAFELEDTERFHITYILKKFKSRIQNELNDGYFDDWDTLIEEYNLRDYSPGVNADIKELITGTRPRVMLLLDLYEQHGLAWREEAKYEDLSQVLRLLNINPCHISKRFPRYPWRVRPAVTPKDFMDLLDNMQKNGGQFVFPIRFNLNEYKDNFDKYHTGITVLKGSQLWLYDPYGGTCSISIPLQRDLTIWKEDLDYSFCDDRDPIAYGLDRICCGLVDSVWNNYIKPLSTASSKPYTLESIEELVNGCSYQQGYSQIHQKWQIRAYNDVSLRCNSKPNVPGELMEFDLKYIDEGFPDAAKKYMRTQADKNAVHYAFKIREVIGSVQMIYGFLIVNYNTGDIVWRHTKYHERSCAILHLVEEKLKTMRLAA